MLEVLSLSYDAGTASVLAKVAAVKESEHVPGVMVRQLGAPEPQARIAVADLPEPHQTAFRALLAALVPIVQGAHGALAKDPDAVARRAAELAEREHRIAAERQAADEEVAARKAELAALDRELAEKRAQQTET